MGQGAAWIGHVSARFSLYNPTRRRATNAEGWLTMPHKPHDRHSGERPSPARLGRQLGARAAVLVVPRRGTDAEDHGLHPLPPAAESVRSISHRMIYGQWSQSNSFDGITRRVTMTTTLSNPVGQSSKLPRSQSRLPPRRQ
jgi:hypothetical protein